MKNTTTKELCIIALLIALVCAATMAITIPIPATSGYVHLGDSVILICSVFFGSGYGLAAGGIGSALADCLGGYAHWAPFTLVIKGVMGYIIGRVSDYNGGRGKFFSLRNMAASFLGVAWMVFGYFLGGAAIKGSFAVSLASVPANVVQGAGGLIIFIVIGYALDKAEIYKYLNAK